VVRLLPNCLALNDGVVRAMSSWLIATVVYMLCLGAFGVTGKLALATLSWPTLVFWTGAGYVVTASLLLALGRVHFAITPGTAWAVLSALLVIVGLISAYIALGAGDVTKVVSISAAYPVVTLILAASFLAESVSAGRLLGTLLVVTGVVLVTVAG
jgi:transporter family protein